MYFSLEDRGHMHAMAYNWPSERVDVIVLTDGSRILGLGDLGVQGMGIPIGKLDLYVAGAGIHPSYVLPVCLDVGTDNAALLSDSCYLGLPRPRVTGADYYATVNELVSALRCRWPNAILQFEDFSTSHASTLLERYRYDFPTFSACPRYGYRVVASLCFDSRALSISLPQTMTSRAPQLWLWPAFTALWRCRACLRAPS